MKNKVFILSLLVLAYGAILGHEVFLGHHLSHNANYHHHCCDSDSHKGSHNNLPCLLDLNPHFIPDVPNLLSDYSEVVSVNHEYLLNTELFDVEFGNIQPSLLLFRTAFELFSPPFTRNFCLRGPPVA